MLYNKKIAVHSVPQMKHVNTLRGKVQNFNFKAVFRHIYGVTAL